MPEITLIDNEDAIRIDFNPVEYALFVKGREVAPGLFERLISSHLQQQQVAQQEAERAQMKTYLDTASPAQRAAVMETIKQSEILTKG